MRNLLLAGHFKVSNSLMIECIVSTIAAILASLVGSCLLSLIRSCRHGLLGQLCLLPSVSSGISLPLSETIFLSKCITVPQLNRHFVSLITTCVSPFCSRRKLRLRLGHSLLFH